MCGWLGGIGQIRDGIGQLSLCIGHLERGIGQVKPTIGHETQFSRGKGLIGSTLPL
ncbi:hypothetical protein PGH26_11980 [Sporosarcina jeotgali]|uniref:Uncharacterized protein n=1 Tax=Sporosarcina jeotgali TaxID=3020056 RepID=A0ABZ0KTN4_9BACL|nr:hypothetical protein [Sporosarcina sp. B2O-1]WOV83595.1 hypothetical protein PGH26_11980 [Sporosarcina sp. B2O-1]